MADQKELIDIFVTSVDGLCKEYDLIETQTLSSITAETADRDGVGATLLHRSPSNPTEKYPLIFTYLGYIIDNYGKVIRSTEVQNTDTKHEVLRVYIRLNRLYSSLSTTSTTSSLKEMLDEELRQSLDKVKQYLKISPVVLAPGFYVCSIGLENNNGDINTNYVIFGFKPQSAVAQQFSQAGQRLNLALKELNVGESKVSLHEKPDKEYEVNSNQKRSSLVEAVVSEFREQHGNSLEPGQRRWRHLYLFKRDSGFRLYVGEGIILH